jgi:uncharacterized membrane protein YtjA (UPF0391 family)
LKRFRKARPLICGNCRKSRCISKASGQASGARAAALRNHSGAQAFFRHLFITTRIDMLGWAVTFLIVALIAAVLGFGGVAGVAVEAAKIIFFVAIVLFVISAVVGLMRGRSPTVL